MCEKAGIDGRRSNHSLRAGCATRMYDNGLDEQLICERTGHRSVAVRSYKRTSSCQLKEVFDALYENVGENVPKVAKTETVTSPSNVKIEESSIGNEKSEFKESVCSNLKAESETSIELTKGFVVNINFNVNK